MTHYSAYLVGPDGHLIDFSTIQATDDDAAVEAAKKIVDGHHVEVWQFDRKIAVLPSKDENTRGG